MRAAIFCWDIIELIVIYHLVARGIRQDRARVAERAAAGWRGPVH